MVVVGAGVLYPLYLQISLNIKIPIKTQKRLPLVQPPTLSIKSIKTRPISTGFKNSVKELLTTKNHIKTIQTTSKLKYKFKNQNLSYSTKAGIMVPTPAFEIIQVTQPIIPKEAIREYNKKESISDSNKLKYSVPSRDLSTINSFANQSLYNK
jgi:hypothetical protein